MRSTGLPSISMASTTDSRLVSASKGAMAAAASDWCRRQAPTSRSRSCTVMTGWPASVARIASSSSSKPAVFGTVPWAPAWRQRPITVSSSWPETTSTLVPAPVRTGSSSSPRPNGPRSRSSRATDGRVVDSTWATSPRSVRAGATTTYPSAWSAAVSEILSSR